MATTATIAELFGRDEELSQLHGLVDNAKRTGGALLLVGEPGIGKTALLGSTIARANELGLRVLSTTGVQSEANLPFAGLHQLVRPILGHAEALPPPQRRALLSAFGELEEPVQNVFLVGLATLGLLTEASTDAPLLVTVDDVQWLDSPSCGALAFVARRLGADHIVFVAALRAGLLGPLTEAGISELRIGPLDDASAERLFEARGSGVPSSMRERVLRAAEGNPLALIDLPSALESFHGEAVGSPPDLLPVTMRLEAAYAARAQGLPATARRLLLIAAVNDSDQIAEAVAAANLLSKETMTADGFAPAEAADLVDLDGARIRFRHPLVRSAMYQKAPSSERRAIHAALATALDREPDRQAWHRAAAVIGPDDGVAKELDRAALRAERRGAIAVAAAALERAAELTTDETDKGARLLRAIHLEFQLGRPGEVTRLMGLAAHLDLAAHDRFMLAGFTAMFDPGIPGDPTLARSMVAAATRAIAEGESDIALDLLRVAAVRAWWADPGDDARAALLDAAKELRVVDDDPRRATVISILALADPLRNGATVLDAIERVAPQLADDAIALRYLAQSAQVVGDLGRAALLYTSAISALRAQGRLGFLASALASQARISIDLGEWRTALPAAEEGARLAEETRQPIWIASALASQALLAGLRGDAAAASALATEAERVARAARQERAVGDRVLISERVLLASIQRARGIASLLAGRLDEAYEQLRRTFEPSDPAFHFMTSWWGLDHLADAAGSNRRDEARAVLARYEPLAALTPASGFRLVIAYARAVLSEDADAEELYLAALDSNLAGWPLMHARLLLAYGTWLRRQRRPTEARAPLRSARDAFDAIGAVPWAERARVELRATGESSQRRDVAAVDQLTPQELQIAQLAADGLSNRDIGHRLYLSHRTVGSHLYRIFPKLGITSRVQLRKAMS